MKTVANCVFALMVLFVPAQPVGADRDVWHPLSDSISVKLRSLAYPREAVASVWIKVIPVKGTAGLSDARRRLRAAGKDVKAFSYSGHLKEIDCGAGRHRELQALYYNEDKNIIHSVSTTGPSWEAIPPEGELDRLREVVCEQLSTAGRVAQEG
jgi:hypothetical protein